MTAKIRRVPAATNLSGARQRARCARWMLKYLRDALAFARYAPRTQARIRKAIASAGGAVRHADGMVTRLEVNR